MSQPNGVENALFAAFSCSTYSQVRISKQFQTKLLRFGIYDKERDFRPYSKTCIVANVYAVKTNLDEKMRKRPPWVRFPYALPSLRAFFKTRFAESAQTHTNPPAYRIRSENDPILEFRSRRAEAKSGLEMRELFSANACSMDHGAEGALSRREERRS